MSSHWKNIERDICAMFGSERSGPLGIHGPDCKDTYPYAIEIKHGKQSKIKKKFLEFMEEAVSEAQDDEIPTLILHPKGSSLDEAWVCFELGHFREGFLDEQ